MLVSVVDVVHRPAGPCGRIIPLVGYQPVCSAGLRRGGFDPGISDRGGSGALNPEPPLR